MEAIILAAGMGMRLRPLTDDRPKALVEIAGESFFARQLRQLRGAGVDRITVVTGYRAEAFEPWRGEAGLDFVRNDRYADRNNLWSMLLVRNRLADCLVLEGDVWLAQGVLPRERPATSCWFVGYRGEMRNEWVVREDAQGRVGRIDVASGEGWILSGLSYWNRADGAVIGRMIEKAALAPGSEQLFWDEMPRRSLPEMDIRACHIGPGDWAEIDTLEDRAALERTLARGSSA